MMLTTQNRLTLSRLALVAAVLFASASMCPSTSTPRPSTNPGETPVPDTDAILNLSGSEEATLDPAKWQGSADGIVGDIFSGLVRLGVTLRPVPDLAESWDISADGAVYTFHLREGVTFHDGRPFTAADVQYSWDRAVSPATASHTAATYLDDIVGVADVTSGKAASISGVKVIDDVTLEVTLDAPKVYFLDKLAYPVAWVVDKETIDEIETSPNGTGPFVLDSHKVNESYILSRNPSYYLDAPQIAGIHYSIYADYASRLYESGDIDILSISEDNVQRALDPNDPLYGNVQAVTGLCTNYVSFDLAQKPFDDPLVRRAFVEAIDKDRYNDTILNGTGIIADGLYPPGVPGFTTELAPLAFDAANALRDLEGSTYGGAAGLPTLTFTTFGAGGNIGASDGLMIQMWKDVLGVDVVAQGLDYDSYYDAVYGDNHGQIMNSGWCADYADPDNFADLFESHSLQNRGHYHSLDVDALLEQARVEKDVKTRLRLYEQVQQHIVDDAAGVFLTHSQAYYVVTKPYLHGYIGTPIGVMQNANLSIDAH